MQLDIGMVFSSLIGLFLLMGVGWVSVKTKIVPPAASAPMSSLLLKVTLPCTIFSSLATREFDSAFLVDGVIIIVIGLVLFPLYAALSWGISKVLKVPAGRRGIWSFGATFCNNGFMGFPVALALFGEEGLAWPVMFGVPFNLLVYTLGVRMVCADCGTDAQPVNLVRTLLSNINIALILSLIFYVGQIPLAGGPDDPRHPSVQCDHTPVHVRHWHGSGLRQGGRAVPGQGCLHRYRYAAHGCPPAHLGGDVPAPPV